MWQRMALRNRSPLHLELSPRVNRTIRRLRRRHSHSYLVLRNFTNTYSYGRTFTLVTDHKPLTTTLGPKRGIPPLAAARLQRWALILAAYTYEIEYRPTGAHGNADGLSRLPLKPDCKEFASNAPAIFNFQQMEKLPVTSK